LYVICLFIRDIYKPHEEYNKNIFRDFKGNKGFNILLFLGIVFWPFAFVCVLGLYIFKIVLNLFKFNEFEWSPLDNYADSFFSFMKANLLLNFSAGIITTLSMIAAFVGVYGCFIGAINYSIFTRIFLPAVIVVCIPFAVVLFLLQFINNIGLFYTSVYQQRKRPYGLKHGLYHFLKPVFILPVILSKCLTYFFIWLGKNDWKIGDTSDEIFITSMVYAGLLVFYGLVSIYTSKSNKTLFNDSSTTK
jgi:hypothetical protein